jgi:hypothetical protein
MVYWQSQSLPVHKGHWQGEVSQGFYFWEFERAGTPSICKGEEQSGLTSPSLLSSIMNGLHVKRFRVFLHKKFLYSFSQQVTKCWRWLTWDLKLESLVACQCLLGQFFRHISSCIPWGFSHSKKWKVQRWSHVQWHDLHTRFHKNLSTDSEVSIWNRNTMQWYYLIFVTKL